jgi:hypothetical protein
LAIHVANILLERGVGHAASTVGDGAAGVLRAGGRGGESDDGEEGESELHFDGLVWCWYKGTEIGYIAGK